MSITVPLQEATWTKWLRAMIHVSLLPSSRNQTQLEPYQLPTLTTSKLLRSWNRNNSVSPSQKLGWNPDVFTPFTSPGYTLISHTHYQECMFAFSQTCFSLSRPPLCNYNRRCHSAWEGGGEKGRKGWWFDVPILAHLLLSVLLVSPPNKETVPASCTSSHLFQTAKWMLDQYHFCFIATSVIASSISAVGISVTAT